TNWTFGQKIGTGFGMLVMMTLAIGLVAFYALRDVSSSMDRVIAVDAQRLVYAERLNGAAGNFSSSARGFLLTKDQRFIERMRESRDEFASTVSQLASGETTADIQRFLETINRSE